MALQQTKHPASQGTQQHRTNIGLVEAAQARVNEDFNAAPTNPVEPYYDEVQFGVRQIDPNFTKPVTKVEQFGNRTVINKIDPALSQESYDQYATTETSSSSN